MSVDINGAQMKVQTRSALHTAPDLPKSRSLRVLGRAIGGADGCPVGNLVGGCVGRAAGTSVTSTEGTGERSTDGAVLGGLDGAGVGATYPQQ